MANKASIAEEIRQLELDTFSAQSGLKREKSKRGFTSTYCLDEGESQILNISKFICVLLCPCFQK
jgi:hypothetical protein